MRQKLEHYSSLEKELQEALVQVQVQQKQLSERETKVRIVLRGWGKFRGREGGREMGREMGYTRD